jgi:hypothetical protein
MFKSAGFQKLRTEYAKLADTTEAKSDDDIKSLRYFEVERALEDGHIVAEPSRRIRDWIDKVRRLEAFVEREGRMTVENRRKDSSEITGDELTLGRWKADQLRAARHTPLSTYQIKRMESLQGFSWAPLDDRWETQFARYAAFAIVKRAPRYRASGAEKETARWAQKQRDLYRRGALAQTRIERLEATGFWTW